LATWYLLINHETKDKKIVLVGGGNWITWAIQDTIFCSINFHALKDAVESDITEAVENWKLKVDQEDPLSAEYMNTLAYCDCKRHSECHGMHCGFEGRGGGPSD
jgi:siroheme synthase (precorrin-2 oxidase/ferrochelatase)